MLSVEVFVAGIGRVLLMRYVQRLSPSSLLAVPVRVHERVRTPYANCSRSMSGAGSREHRKGFRALGLPKEWSCNSVVLNAGGDGVRMDEEEGRIIR